ncbi:hypothetical protein [Timonella senegalensis]|uniref:hypothetical protein n=1 Tax=Timonella senegalensis TaxID=1465825 RepID=UPI0028B20444|nr:hypothetical protein [Timonella senegalensis]
MFSRKSVGSVALLVGATVLSGCGGEGEGPGGAHSGGVKPSGEQLVLKELDASSLFEDPNADWSESYWRTTVEGAAVLYEAFGAGGCPPSLESADLEDATLTLHATDFGDGPCAESGVFFRTEIMRADGSAFPSNLDVIMDNPTKYYENY